MPLHRFAAACLAVAAGCAIATAPMPWAASKPDRVERIEPFKVNDGAYFVGARGFRASMKRLEIAFEGALAEATQKAQAK